MQSRLQVRARTRQPPQADGATDLRRSVTDNMFLVDKTAAGKGGERRFHMIEFRAVAPVKATTIHALYKEKRGEKTKTEFLTIADKHRMMIPVECV